MPIYSRSFSLFAALFALFAAASSARADDAYTMNSLSKQVYGCISLEAMQGLVHDANDPNYWDAIKKVQNKENSGICTSQGPFVDNMLRADTIETKNISSQPFGRMAILRWHVVGSNTPYFSVVLQNTQDGTWVDGVYAGILMRTADGVKEFFKTQ